MKNDTFPKLLYEKFQTYGDREIAFRQKKFGIWNSYTWKDYYENVKYLGLGLMALGLGVNDKVSIIGENGPEWYWAELACQAIGGVAVGIFTDCSASEVKYLVEYSDSKIVFAHDQEQVDKVLEIAADLPLLKKVIYWERKGLWFYNDDRLLFIGDLIQMGRSYEEKTKIDFEDLIMKRSGDELAFILYTSGSTGLPKAAMLTHQAYIKASHAASSANPIYPTDEYVSFVPPAWSAEQFGGVVNQLTSGMTVSFPESPETARRDIREIAPHILTFGPRQWEGLCAEIQGKMGEATGLKKWAYKLFMPLGYRALNPDLPFLIRRFIYWIANLILYHGLKDELGLIRARICVTGGSVLSPDVIRFYSAIGVKLRQLYGSTEFPVISIHWADDIKNETVGRPLPHWEEVRISDQGEVIVKGPCIFKGYYKNEKATMEAVKEGWGYTGDSGLIDEDGHLIIHGRLQDFRELKGGKRFSPDYIETRLRFSPYIKDCMATGGKDREYVGLLITIDLDNVGNWAESRGLDFTTYADLSQKGPVYELIKSEIQTINNYLPAEAKAKKFAILAKELDPDEAELTRTRKLRRNFMEEKNSAVIDAIYSGRSDYDFDMEIVYRDGRKGHIKSNIRIEEV